MTLNSKALEAAFDILWPTQEWNGEERVCRAVLEATVTAYLAALPTGDLVERLGKRAQRFGMLASDPLQEHPDAKLIREAAARIQALEQALEPFAQVADEYDDSDDDTHEVWIDAGPEKVIRGSFALRNYRAARAALNPEVGE